MLKCYIIDDEPHAIRSLLSYVNKTPILQLAGYSEFPLKAVKSFEEDGLYPDITFLDIDMPDISGIELSLQLKGKTTVIFTTGHADYAVDAYDQNITDYLLKPFSYERFLKCISKIESAKLQQGLDKPTINDFLYVQSEGKGKIIKISFTEINFIESHKNYLSVSTSEKKHLTYLTLKELEERLPDSFLRINKSTIINTDKISYVEGNQVFLLNWRNSFTITATYKCLFEQHLKQHLIKTRRSGYAS